MVVSEFELLAKAKELDTNSLAEIYDRYSPRVYRYAFRLLGDTCRAEDCVAETFSRFLHGLRDGKGPRQHLQAYLFRIAHNYVVDQYRKTPTEELDEQTSDPASVEADAGRHLRQQRLRRAIQELSLAQQQVISLKFWEDCENEEIAHVLHKPVGAVKSLQHRALNRLQKILADEKS